MTDKKMSVLLVDDDPDTRNVFQLVLSHFDLELTVAEDAETAFSYLGSHKPDVIVMDIFLPGLDGYQALQHIRKNALVPDCHIVATTAYYTPETPKDVLAWGFSGYLQKPLNPTKLVPYLQQIVAGAVPHQ